MSKIKTILAKQALLRLIHGNKRFVRRRSGAPLPTQKDISRLMLKVRGPFAIILSCSDSRAPAEILFDQGLGDLFVIRVAGNIVAPSQVGSVEFAAATTQAQLVVVMGHTQCGAINATLDAIAGKKSVPADNIKSIVERIRPHIINLTKNLKDTRQRDQIWGDAVRANVLASADHLRHGSRFLEELVRKKKLVIVGAEYCIETGIVNFFDNPLAKGMNHQKVKLSRIKQ